MKSYYELDKNKRKEYDKQFRNTSGGRELFVLRVAYYLALLVIFLFDVVVIPLLTLELPVVNEVTLLFIIIFIILALFLEKQYMSAYKSWLKVKCKVEL